MNSKKKAEVKEDVALVATGGEVTLPAEVTGGTWGAIENLDTNDIVVPKVFHQQALSEYASAGLASVGDFCDSVTGEVLATKSEGLEIIVFGSYKTLMIQKQDAGGKYKFEKSVMVTPGNAEFIALKPFYEEENGEHYRNMLYYNYYCLIPEKINELPFVVSLGSTKTKVAKKLNTLITKLSQMGKPGASRVFLLSNVTEKNDEGQWLGLSISESRQSTNEELLKAHSWYQKSQVQNFVVQEEEEGAAPVTDSGPAPTGPVEEVSDDVVF